MLTINKIFKDKNWKKFGKRMRIRKQGHRRNVHIASDAPGTDGRFFIVVIEDDFEHMAELFTTLAIETRPVSEEEKKGNKKQQKVNGEAQEQKAT